MSPKLIMACFGICIIGTMYSLIDSGIWFGAEQVDFLNAVAGINAVEVKTLGGYTLPQMPQNWIGGLLTMVLWDYPFLDNSWGFILKLVLLYPCTVGVIMTVWQMFIVVLQGLAGLVRSLIP